MLCLKKRQRRPASLKSSVRCFHFLISSCLLAFPPCLLQIQIKTRSPKTREENKPRRLPAVWRGRCFADADGSICWQIISGHVVRRTDAAAASVQTGSPGDRMRKDQSSVSWFWSHLTAKAGLLSCLLCKSRHPHSIWSYNKDKNRISMLQNDHIYCVMADIHCQKVVLSFPYRWSKRCQHFLYLQLTWCETLFCDPSVEGSHAPRQWGWKFRVHCLRHGAVILFVRMFSWVFSVYFVSCFLYRCAFPPHLQLAPSFI